MNKRSANNLEEYLLPDLEELETMLKTQHALKVQIETARKEYEELLHDYREELSNEYDPTDKNEELDFCMQISAIEGYEEALKQTAQRLYYLSLSYARQWQKMIGTYYKNYYENSNSKRRFTDKEMDELLELL